MSTILEQFQHILKSIDANLGSVIDQQHIIDEFGKIVPQEQELSMEEKAEGLAFSFADRFTRIEDGRYFGPRVTMRGEDGSVYESPSLKQVQPEMIAYWKGRAASVQHPFLAARFLVLLGILLQLWEVTPTMPYERSLFSLPLIW